MAHWSLAMVACSEGSPLVSIRQNNIDWGRPRGIFSFPFSPLPPTLISFTIWKQHGSQHWCIESACSKMHLHWKLYPWYTPIQSPAHFRLHQGLSDTLTQWNSCCVVSSCYNPQPKTKPGHSDWNVSDEHNLCNDTVKLAKFRIWMTFRKPKNC